MAATPCASPWQTQVGAPWALLAVLSCRSSKLCVAGCTARIALEAMLPPGVPLSAPLSRSNTTLHIVFSWTANLAGDTMDDANYEHTTANGAILRLTKELAWIGERGWNKCRLRSALALLQGAQTLYC